jgi:hypothetical protein
MQPWGIYPQYISLKEEKVLRRTLASIQSIRRFYNNKRVGIQVAVATFHKAKFIFSRGLVFALNMVRHGEVHFVGSRCRKGAGGSYD